MPPLVMIQSFHSGKREENQMGHVQTVDETIHMYLEVHNKEWDPVLDIEYSFDNYRHALANDKLRIIALYYEKAQSYMQQQDPLYQEDEWYYRTPPIIYHI